MPQTSGDTDKETPVSKGSGRRPSKVSEEAVKVAWDRIFNDGVPDVDDKGPSAPVETPKDDKRANDPRDSCF